MPGAHDVISSFDCPSEARFCGVASSSPLEFMTPETGTLQAIDAPGATQDVPAVPVRSRWIALASSALSLFVGGLGIAGWWFGMPALARWVASLPRR